MPRRVVRTRKQSEPSLHWAALDDAVCFGKVRFAIEPNPMRAVPGHTLIVVRCEDCGQVLDVRGVLPEPELVNNDDDKGEKANA